MRRFKQIFRANFKFTHQDLHHKNAKFSLVKFGIASSAFLSKKQPFKVVFYFVVKGVGT